MVVVGMDIINEVLAIPGGDMAQPGPRTGILV